MPFFANRNAPKLANSDAHISANRNVQFLANKNAHFLLEEEFLLRKNFPFFHLNQNWGNKTT